MGYINWLRISSIIGTILNLTIPMRWAIDSLASLMNFFFRDNRHSITDIIAGVLMLGQVSRNVPKSVNEAPKPSEDWQKQYFDRKTWEVENVERFVDYAMAMYNTPTPVYIMPLYWLLRPTKLFWEFFYLSPFNIFTYLPFHQEVIGDGFLHRKTAAFMASTPSRTNMTNLKYANFSSGIFQTPFCICIDHISKAIVVSIRGSTSIQDFLTNINAMTKEYPSELVGKEFDMFPLKETPKNAPPHEHSLIRDMVGGVVGRVEHVLHLDQIPKAESTCLSNNSQQCYPFIHLNDGKKAFVHPFTYLCAKSIIGDVETQLLSLLSNESAIKNGYSNYKIVVTGHSLGAGIASLLALMLRKNYGERVRGYCFSPPGCMISEEGLEETRKCILSFVVGDDIVPRFSLHSMKDLHNDCVHIMDLKNRTGGSLFKSVKWPVYGKFLLQFATWPLFGPFAVFFVNIPEKFLSIVLTRLYKIDLPTAFAIKGPSFVDADSKMDKADSMLRLYAPGQLLHLMVNEMTCEVTPRWIHHADLQEIVVGWRMIPDHLAKHVGLCVKREKHFIYRLPGTKFLPIEALRLIELFF